MLSPGQQALHEMVAPTAAELDASLRWNDEPARSALLELRARVLADPRIRQDAVTGQNLRRPSTSTTYAFAQMHASFPRRQVDRHVLPSAALIYNRLAGSSSDPLPACSGGTEAEKPWTVFGAMTFLARGEDLPVTTEPPNPTILTGSGIVIAGSGGNHRTLACFLWAGELRGRITLIDDQPDHTLLAACETIDSRLPDPVSGITFLGEDPARRSRLLELAAEVAPFSGLDLRAAAPRYPAAIRVPQTFDFIDQAVRRQRRSAG